MKKIKTLLIILLTLICISVEVKASIIEESTIKFGEQNVKYTEIGKYHESKFSPILLSETQKIITKIQQLQTNLTPENRIEIFELQTKLPYLVKYLVCCGTFNSKEVLPKLRSVGYPISDYELEDPNYRDFFRAPSPVDLIALVKEYPNTEYEKEALYLISVESSAYLNWGMMGGIPNIKRTIYKIQAAKLFLEKYREDERKVEIEKVLNDMKSLYQEINNSEESYLKIADFEKDIDHYYAHVLNNGKLCTSDEIIEETCNVPDYPKFPTVPKKLPLDQVLSSPLGYIEYEDPIEPIPDYIKQAQTRGYLQGYPDGTLKLENPVNRAEFAKMLMMAFEQGDGNVDNIKKFPDVQTAEWYAKPLAKAVELEIMQGYPDGNMKPAETIIMIEAVKMVLETKYPEEDFTPSILSKWYSEYLSFIKENFPEISFVDGDLEHEMTRGECVELIEGIIEN